MFDGGGAGMIRGTIALVLVGGSTRVISELPALLADELVDADDAMIDDDGAAETAAAPRSVPHELGRFLRVEPDPGDVDIVLLV
jgi:hypothetical protein